LTYLCLLEKVMKNLVSSVLLATILGMGASALAQPETQTSLELDGDMPGFENRELTQGPVKVVASYQPIDYEAEVQEDNLQLDLYYQGELRQSVTETVFMFGSVDLNDLDSDGTPEVLLQAYTGGAHCCMAITTYTWQEDRFRPIYFDYLDGGGGRFEDLDGDGLTEFVTLDNAFLYTFSSYAGSYPPSLILTFQDGEYIDTTNQFQQRLGSTAWDMYQSVEQRDEEGYEINGLLAGYVAQKIRLGEYRQGWDFMMARYERGNDWGLQSYDNDGNVVEEFADFPTALQAFLQDLGYLDASGNPKPGVDRSPVVPERMR
jgi:hypothetical protein